MNATPPHHLPPATLLVWTLHDALLEAPPLLRRQFEEIRGAGFGGVAPWIRCSRYAWTDPLAHAALRTISRLCARHRLELWIGADPRFISRELIGETGGLELILFGDTPRASRFPLLVPPEKERYSVRCSLHPRHVHTLTDVAIEYHPLSLAGVYAVRTADPPPGRGDILDLTPGARMFFNARDQYVEAFGSDRRLLNGSWQVMAFFHVRTNHVDFSDRRQMDRYLALLARLRRKGIVTHGVMWDEPGFTCTYGTIPYSPVIRRAYARRTGRPIERDLWKFAFDAKDGSHAPLRIAYYREIQQGITIPHRRMQKAIRRIWGSKTISGIHDTWHFESGDMCDMNHGSLDLWEGLKAKSGGFVDLGGVDQLRDPDSPWYDNLAALSVVAASLGRASRGKFACNNLWTVGDDGGAGWQAEAMSHCVDVMAAFGTRWLAHAYGPVGTIGEEDSFLGSPPLPGYPNHSTWPRFPEWNRRLSRHLRRTEDRLPWANLLLLFPVESLYAFADQRADRAAGEVFRLLRLLLDHHYHPDLLSPSFCAGGRWVDGSFVLGKARYAAVVAPFAPPGLSWPGNSGRPPSGRLFTLGASAATRSAQQCADDAELLGVLSAIPGLRPIEAPERSWATLTRLRDGILVTLTPSRAGYSFGGRVSTEGMSVGLQPGTGLRAIRLRKGKAPEICNDEEGEE